MVLKSAIFNGKFFILRHFVHFVDFFFEMFSFCDDLKICKKTKNYEKRSKMYQVKAKIMSKKLKSSSLIPFFTDDKEKKLNLCVFLLLIVTFDGKKKCDYEWQIFYFEIF